MATTFDDLILAAEAEQDEEQRRMDKALHQVKVIHSKARDEARGLEDDEQQTVASCMAAHEQAKRQKAKVAERLVSQREARAAEKANDEALAKRFEDAGAKPEKRAYDQVARVGAEERTYNLGQGNGDHKRASTVFLNDIVRQYLYQDIDASMRLQRHMAEERVERGQYLTRAVVGTGAFSGLVVPQYLTDFYAPAVAARRPFADACSKLPLPAAGMTVNISRITTGSSVGKQSAQGDPVSEQDMDDTLLTVNVLTAAGSQDLSRQAVDRGTGVETVVMQDLQRRFATDLDSTLINQSSTGLSAIATGVTFDDTTPLVVEAYPKIFEAIAGSEAALLGQAHPDIVVMHSRRWQWFQNALISTHPLIQQQGVPDGAGGLNYATRYGSGYRGLLPNGMPVIVDNNVATNLGSGTNQDEIYIVPSEESWLWEDPNAPQFIRAEQPSAKNLAVTLVLYGYYAYTFARYSGSHRKIAGTGLVTPTYVGQ